MINLQGDELLVLSSDNEKQEKCAIELLNLKMHSSLVWQHQLGPETIYAWFLSKVQVIICWVDQF